MQPASQPGAEDARALGLFPIPWAGPFPLYCVLARSGSRVKSRITPIM